MVVQLLLKAPGDHRQTSVEKITLNQMNATNGKNFLPVCGNKEEHRGGVEYEEKKI